jgi:hypothetical protein
MRRLIRPGQRIEVIGDAFKAGKARDAIDGAFRAALLADRSTLLSPGEQGS